MPYIGYNVTNAGSFALIDDIASTFNGSNTAFTLQVGGVNITPNVQNLLIAIDGVVQQAPDAYSVSGSTITFTGAPASGADFYGVLMGQSSYVENNSITADELAVSGDGSSGQLLSSDGDGTFSWLSSSSITSVGTLSSLTVSGVASLGNNSKVTSASADTTFKIETTSGTTIFPVLDFVSSHSSVGAKIRQDGADVITIDNDQDVTFADDITVSGNSTFAGDLTISNSIPLIFMNDTSGNKNNQIIFQENTNNIFRIGTDITTNDGTQALEITDGDGNNPRLTIDSSGNSTFAGNVTINSPSGDTGWGLTVTNSYSSSSDVSISMGYANSSNRNSGIGVSMDDTNSGEYLLNLASGGTDRFRVRGDGLAYFTGLLQAKRGFTNGQALDIEGETFGRTNGSDYAFGYRQDHASGGLMKMQKGSSNVFLMTNSGRIAQEINESSAYAATFENTSSGGYGLRVYGGASWADNALLVNDHNGNEAFAVKGNGITVSDGKIRQAYVTATFPQNSTTTRTFNLMTLLGVSAGTPYGVVELLFNIYTNGGNWDCEVHRVTVSGYMHAGYNQDQAWNLVHEILDAGTGNSAISSITLTGTGGDLNIAYVNGDTNDDAYLRGILRGSVN